MGCNNRSITELEEEKVWHWHRAWGAMRAGRLLEARESFMTVEKINACIDDIKKAR